MSYKSNSKDQVRTPYVWQHIWGIKANPKDQVRTPYVWQHIWGNTEKIIPASTPNMRGSVFMEDQRKHKVV